MKESAVQLAVLPFCCSMATPPMYWHEKRSEHNKQAKKQNKKKGENKNKKKCKNLLNF